MGKQEELLQNLATELQQLAARPLKWTSPEAKARSRGLEVIWYELVELSTRPKAPLYRKLEELQLEVLRQMSRVDAERYKFLRAQLRGGRISIPARISLTVIRLRSKTDRTFEKIDRIWIGQEEAQRRQQDQA